MATSWNGTHRYFASNLASRLAWTFFGGVVSNLFFFDRPGIAFFGGIAFALFFLPYAFSRWLGRP